MTVFRQTEQPTKYVCERLYGSGAAVATLQILTGGGALSPCQWAIDNQRGGLSAERTQWRVKLSKGRTDLPLAHSLVPCDWRTLKAQQPHLEALHFSPLCLFAALSAWAYTRDAVSNNHTRADFLALLQAPRHHLETTPCKFDWIDWIGKYAPHILLAVYP